MDILIPLITLTAMEIVLGIDNIIFIAILVARLPKMKQANARAMGLIIALFFRVALLFSLTWIMSLTEPLMTILQHGFSGRDLILLGGGIFLLIKSTNEIHQKITQMEEHTPDMPAASGKHPKFLSIVVQIIMIDIVFSFDSVITAVGMVQNLNIMVAAVVISMFVMIGVSGKISEFIDKNPTIKILALAFLIMIGTMLVAEGMGMHVTKGYLYFAMAFSLAVESLNITYRKKQDKIRKK